MNIQSMSLGMGLTQSHAGNQRSHQIIYRGIIVNNIYLDSIMDIWDDLPESWDDYIEYNYYRMAVTGHLRRVN